MIRVLYYIPDITKNNGGTYQYSLALLNILAELDNRKFKIFVLYNSRELEISKIVEKSRCLNKILVNEISFFKLSYYGIKLILNIIKFFHLNFFFNKDFTFHYFLSFVYKINIIHSPVQSLRAGYKTKTISTMHDVQELHFPEFFTSTERASRAVNYKKTIDNSDIIVVSYNHIKIDIIKYFNKEPENVKVVLLNMKKLWFDKFDKKNIVQIKDVPSFKNFILYPAATWEHKNHLKLIEALLFLKKKKNIVINLVCTGAQTPYYETIKQTIKEYGLADQVAFLGIVSDEKLFCLYQKCTAVVIPTLYEAGSFPLMESLLMNIPVVCSNVTSLPKTINNDIFIFNPYDARDIADKIEKVCFNKEYRKEAKTNCLKQSSILRQNSAKDEIEHIYDKLYNEQQCLV